MKNCTKTGEEGGIKRYLELCAYAHLSYLVDSLISLDLFPYSLLH